MNPNERMWKLKDIEDTFRVSRATVWRWRNEHGLKTVAVGNVVRIRDSDLQAFLQRHQANGGSVEPANN